VLRKVSRNFYKNIITTKNVIFYDETVLTSWLPHWLIDWVSAVGASQRIVFWDTLNQPIQPKFICVKRKQFPSYCRFPKMTLKLHVSCFSSWSRTSIKCDFPQTNIKEKQGKNVQHAYLISSISKAVPFSRAHVLIGLILVFEYAELYF
jgi:hypothetical protein